MESGDERPITRQDKLVEAIRGAIRRLAEADEDFEHTWMVMIQSAGERRQGIGVIAGPEAMRIRIEPMAKWADPTRGDQGRGKTGRTA